MAVVAALAALFVAVAQAVSGPDYAPYVHGGKYINYTTVTGYFLQDDPSTNATTFNYVRAFEHIAGFDG